MELNCQNRPEKKDHWLIKPAIVGSSAIISAIVAGYLGTCILILLWESEVAAIGIVVGPPIGFLIGLRTSTRYLKKQMPALKTIGISSLVAVSATGLIFGVFGFIGWIGMSLNL